MTRIVATIAIYGQALGFLEFSELVLKTKFSKLGLDRIFAFLYNSLGGLEN